MKGQGNGNPLSQTEKRLYNLKEAAIYLGRTVWGMRGLVYAGKITYVKDSRRFYFDKRDLDSFIEDNKRVFEC